MNKTSLVGRRSSGLLTLALTALLSPLPSRAGELEFHTPSWLARLKQVLPCVRANGLEAIAVEEGRAQQPSLRKTNPMQAHLTQDKDDNRAVVARQTFLGAKVTVFGSGAVLCVEENEGAGKVTTAMFDADRRLQFVQNYDRRLGLRQTRLPSGEMETAYYREFRLGLTRSAVRGVLITRRPVGGPEVLKQTLIFDKGKRKFEAFGTEAGIPREHVHVFYRMTGRKLYDLFRNGESVPFDPQEPSPRQTDGGEIRRIPVHRK